MVKDLLIPPAPALSRERLDTITAHVHAPVCPVRGRLGRVIQPSLSRDPHEKGETSAYFIKVIFIVLE